MGYSQADITPDRPMELVGFYREDNRSSGVLKPLLAQVTVWEAEEKCCLISVDSIGFTKELSDALRNRVGGCCIFRRKRNSITAGMKYSGRCSSIMSISTVCIRSEGNPRRR